MNRQDNIDQLFKDKLSERVFEYDDQYWLEAEKMIRDREAKRRFWRGFSLSAILLIVASSVGIWAYNGSTDPSGEKIANHAPGSDINNPDGISSGTEVAGHSIEDEITASGELNNADMHSTRPTEDLGSSNTPSGNEHYTTSDATPAADRGGQAAIDEPASPAAQTGQGNPASNPDKSDSERQLSPTGGAALALGGSETGNTTDPVSTGSSNVGTQADEPQASTTGSDPDAMTTASVSDGHDATDESPELSGVGTPDESTDAEAADMTGAIAGLSYMPGEPMPALYGIQSDNDKGKALIVPAAEPEMPKDDSPFTIDRKHLYGVGLVAGIGVTRSRQDGELNTWGYDESWLFGVKYERLVANQVSVAAQALFTSRNAYGLNVTIEELDYDFGYNGTTTNYQFRSLYYLEFPVYVNYRFSTIHSAGIGLSYGHLLTSKYSHTTETSSTIAEPVTSEETRWGRTDAYNSHDLALIGRYEYQASERIALGFHLRYGLVDVTNDEVIGVSRTDKNHQARMVIIYQLFK